MALSGSGRRTAVLCAAVVLFASVATPAAAVPVASSPLAVPASPEIPSPEDIAAAKASESATADRVASIERILADASAAQQAAFAVAMQANNSYSEALVELQQRKLSLIDDVLSPDSVASSSLTEADLRELLALGV